MLSAEIKEQSVAARVHSVFTRPSLILTFLFPRHFIIYHESAYILIVLIRILSFCSVWMQQKLDIELLENVLIQRIVLQPRISNILLTSSLDDRDVSWIEFRV